MRLNDWNLKEYIKNRSRFSGKLDIGVIRNGI